MQLTVVVGREFVHIMKRHGQGIIIVMIMLFVEVCGMAVKNDGELDMLQKMQDSSAEFSPI